MAQPELQLLIDTLAQRIGAGVLLEDSRGGMVAYSPGQEDTDATRLAVILRREVPFEVERYVREMGVFAATEPMRVVLPPSIAPGHRGRLAVPVRYGDQNLGALWIVDGGVDLGEERVRAAQAAARRAGLLLYEERLNDRLGAQMLAQLLSGVEELRRESAAELRRQGFTRPYVVAVLRPAAPDLDADHRIAVDVAGARIAGRSGERLVLAMPDHLVLLETAAAEDPGWAETLLDRLDASPSGHDHRWVCGIGDRRTALVDARVAHQEAQRASDLALARGPEGRVQRWPDMGPFRLLVTVPPRAAEDALDPRIRPLLDPAQALIADTLERYLDLAGDVAATAAALGVHRGTVYYRLARAEALTGMRLADGLDRLALHMALKLHGIRGDGRPA